MPKIIKQIISVTIVLFMCNNQTSAQKKYSYKTVPNDPTQTRIYKLDNGLTVYISRNTEEPKIQTYVVTRVGSKNDPEETTGLAHYFEHMMFKGTEKIGTKDWAKEKILIEQIDSLFEVYRKETDEDKRAEIYRRIDSLSYLASKYAIPNEYDKLMKLIGSKGTNAFTSNDITAYVEEIPSNQLENWAKIQSDRFTSPVLRLFHTELETVYEEYNMSLTNDGRRIYETMLKTLFPNHPYGKQTTLGKPEHLKNPSMKNIREFFAKYYVPNNMAVVLCGDVDPDKAIEIIDKYFGHLKSKPIPELKYEKEKPIEKPIIKEIYGKEADEITIAFPFGGSKSDDPKYLNIISRILFNEKAGLIDLNLLKNQKVLNANAYYLELSDYGTLVLWAKPKEGQTLEECKDLLIEQINKLRKGEFDEWLLEAAINNFRYFEYKNYETNRGRAMLMVRSFGAGKEWDKVVNSINEMSKLTKNDIMNFITKNINENYVIIYKRKGTIDEPKVKKPPITPIHINRDDESEFFREIKNKKVDPITPEFVDFNKVINKFNVGKIPVLYIENKENPTFEMHYYFEIGSQHDKLLELIPSYFEFISTSKYTTAQIQQELYKYAATISFNVQGLTSSVIISGLSDNLNKVLLLFEEILQDAQPDETAYNNLVNNIIKIRKDALLNQKSNSNALYMYSLYGEKNPYNDILSEDELKQLKAKDIIQKLKELFQYEHQILYYGNHKPEQLKEILKIHKTPDNFKVKPTPTLYIEKEIKENVIFFAHYDANQAYIQSVIRGEKYDKNKLADINIFNSYFGGSMNSIVFQELREKRSLAYTARSTYRTPETLDNYETNYSFIATQSDKTIDAITAFEELFNNMPLSETLFQLAKNSAITSIATDRITKMNIIRTYLKNKMLQIDYDIRKDIYEKLKNMTLENVRIFNEKYIKNKPKAYSILGRENEINFKELEKFGKIIKLTQKDIFGYQAN